MFADRQFPDGNIITVESPCPHRGQTVREYERVSRIVNAIEQMLRDRRYPAADRNAGNRDIPESTQYNLPIRLGHGIYRVVMDIFDLISRKRFPSDLFHILPDRQRGDRLVIIKCLAAYPLHIKRQFIHRHI